MTSALSIVCENGGGPVSTDTYPQNAIVGDFRPLHGLYLFTQNQLQMVKSEVVKALPWATSALSMVYENGDGRQMPP